MHCADTVMPLLLLTAWHLPLMPMTMYEWFWCGCTFCRLQAASTGEGKLERDGVSGISEISKQDEEKSVIKFEPIPMQNLAHSEDFYPSTALNALLKQLSDMKMAPQHQEVITALLYIFKDLKLGSVQYLQYTMPVLLQVVRMSDEGLQAFIVRQLIDLVRIVQAHMRPYLNDLLDLIIGFWDYSRPKLLTLMLLLLAKLAAMLQEDMRDNAGRLVPLFVNLFQEAERSGEYNTMDPALHVCFPQLLKLHRGPICAHNCCGLDLA